MTNEIQMAKDMLPKEASKATVQQISNEGMQIGHAENVNANTTVIIASGNQRDSKAISNASLNGMNKDYYNLFIIGNEEYDGEYFVVPSERVLSSGTTDETKSKFYPLTSETIETIKSMPSIFASENHEYGKTDSNHFAIYGLVTDIKVVSAGLRIYFKELGPVKVPQQLLNEKISQLDIYGTTHLNELNRTHWAIKNIDLIQELKNEGINLFSL